MLLFKFICIHMYIHIHLIYYVFKYLYMYLSTKKNARQKLTPEAVAATQPTQSNPLGQLSGAGPQKYMQRKENTHTKRLIRVVSVRQSFMSLSQQSWDSSVPIKPITRLVLKANSSSQIGALSLRINSTNTQQVSNTKLVGIEQFVGLFSDISAAN